MTVCIDVANYTPVPTPQQVACLIADGYTRAVVGCSYGNVARAQLEAFSNGGMEIEAYCWVTHPLTLQPIDKAINVCIGLPVKRLWLDCEAPPNKRTPAQIVDDIDDAVRYATRYFSGEIGIYTGSWWWPVTGPTQNTWGLPLWLANYRDPAKPLTEADVPGGWTVADVALWQYAGTVTTCGLNTDRNLILEATGGDDEMVPIRIWCAERAKTYLFGPFGAVPIDNPADDKALEKLYGPHAAVLTGATLDALK